MSDREAIAQANLLHEALWGKRPKLGPHPAIVDALTAAERRGYERGLDAARAKITALPEGLRKGDVSRADALDALRGGAG